MFAKKKKTFPPGTFIPTPQRIISIIQLCLVFTLVLWLGGYPFMGEHFAIKSKTTLFNFVLGSPESPNKEAALKNAARFSVLSKEKQTEIRSSYHDLQVKASRSFWEKMGNSIKILFFHISPFTLVWMIFSAIISIMVLRKNEGARHAAWLLPVIVLAYGIDNILNGTVVKPAADIELFPSEKLIIEQYLNEPLGSSISVQEQQLRKGWNLYLVKEWAHEKPSLDKNLFTEQVENGEFAFNLARLQKLNGSKEVVLFSDMRPKEPMILIIMYFAWNLFFAYMLNKRTKNSVENIQS